MKKQKKRWKNDFYPTSKASVVLQAIDDLIDPNETVFECCNGQGHLSRPLKHYCKQVITNDIVIYRDAQNKPLSNFQFDATNRSNWNVIRAFKPTLTLSNPPYKDALSIIENAFDLTPKVYMLLRLSFNEPCLDRRGFLKANKKHLKRLITINPRISPHDDGTTDRVTQAWFCWDQNYNGLTDVDYFTWVKNEQR